jgi:hypothetical protein
VIAPADASLIITLQDRLYNKEVIIRPISPYKTYRSLGTEQGTSKNQKQQHEKLRKTSGTHIRKLACSAMMRKCAWVYYTAVFQSSVGYPLSMCHLSQHQLHDLQEKYIPTLMNKMGIARTHAHALVFGPRSYGGIGCNDLRIKQGLDAVQNLIGQLTGFWLWRQKLTPKSSIETQYNSVQGHVLSYILKRSPVCFVWAAPQAL